MLISDNHKFIFVHIPKNAGSSMTYALMSVGGKELPEYDTHVPSNILRQELPQFDDYFKFAFVRNPWDRMYSMYKFTLRRGWMPKETTYEEFLHRDDLHVTEACKYQTPIVPITKKPQLDFIVDDSRKLMVDYVGRYESITEDFNHICDQLNINVRLPHINASPGIHYKDAYNQKTKEFIQKYFEEDIDTFKYTF